jgi:branched-chain amino acid transport system substrate-binding protein
MRFFLFLAACVAFTLTVGGCADYLRQAGIVSQKQPATYKSNYQAPENKQNAPLPSVVTAPLPSALQVKLKAAILLPLSGKNADLGQAMLNAAQQALFDAAEADFELQPRDTAGEGGAEEAARAAATDGARLIIGPLFATDVPIVKLVAQIYGLPMLPLSTDTSLADRTVYVMGLAPGAQVERVVAYAMAHGAHNFAALVPSTPYGNLVGEVFRKVVWQGGETLVEIEYFDPSAHDVGSQIKTLAARRDRIDALFLPESGDALKFIADQLTAAGFNPAHTHILGTGLWDVPEIGRQSPLLVGGWYAAPDPALRRNFISSYVAAYSQEPPRLATLAYDATALAAVLAKHAGNYDEAALTNPNGFAGLDGIFRLTTSGGVERAMAVIEVTQSSARVVDPAPTSFVSTKR